MNSTKRRGGHGWTARLEEDALVCKHIASCVLGNELSMPDARERVPKDSGVERRHSILLSALFIHTCMFAESEICKRNNRA